MQLWAIAQERCSFSPYHYFMDEGLQLTPSLISSTFTVSVPFPSTVLLDPPARFSSILTLNTAQAFGSLVASFLYLMVRRPSSPPSVKATLGLDRKENTQPLLFGYFKIALLNTCAAPFGFASLRHISYPTMVLGKSCKLVPVLFMNVSRLPVLTLLLRLMKVAYKRRSSFRSSSTDASSLLTSTSSSRSSPSVSRSSCSWDPRGRRRNTRCPRSSPARVGRVCLVSDCWSSIFSSTERPTRARTKSSRSSRASQVHAYFVFI